MWSRTFVCSPAVHCSECSDDNPAARQSTLLLNCIRQMAPMVSVDAKCSINAGKAARFIQSSHS